VKGRRLRKGHGALSMTFMHVVRKSAACCIGLASMVLVACSVQPAREGATSAQSSAQSEAAVTEPLAPGTPPSPTGWTVRRSGSERNTLEIIYGGFFQEYAALHGDGAYVRMKFGNDSGWGTAVRILPSFWSGGTYYESAPIATGWRIDGNDLLIVFSAVLHGLTIHGEMKFEPPGPDAFVATLNVTTDGTVALDSRPGESFKPVSLLSMHANSNIWDTSSAFVGSRVFPFPGHGRIIEPPVAGTVFGLNGGTSRWKANAPTFELTMDHNLEITGSIADDSNPNNDNVTLWAASSEPLRSWHVRIRALRSLALSPGLHN
jgi:hypothetical protein